MRIRADEILVLDEWTSHSAVDETYVAALAASMQARGWFGPPVLTFEVQGSTFGVTGTHRIAAARQVGILVEVLPLESVSELSLNDVAGRIRDASGGYNPDNLEIARVAFALAAPHRIEEWGLEIDDVEGLLDWIDPAWAAVA